MRRLVAMLAVLVLAACSPAPSPLVSPIASPRQSPSSAPSATTPSAVPPSAAASSSPAPIAPTPIPTPNVSLSLPTPVTARVNLSGPSGFRTTTSAVAGAGAIWVSTYQHVGAWLVRIDPVAGSVTRTTSLPDQLAPAELAVGASGTLWAAGPVGLAAGGESTPPGLIARLDPASGRVVAQATLPLQGQIDPDTDVVWVPSGSGLRRLDQASMKVSATYPVDGTPATQCGLSVTESVPTSTVRYLDPATGAVTSTLDLGVDGRLLGNDPVEGMDNCWALIGPLAGGDPATSGFTLAELGLVPTMSITGQSPPFHGDVRYAADVFWLIANGTMTAVDPLTLAPLDSTWLLPSDVTDLTAWTLLGSAQTLWWVGPTEALRVGIPIPFKQAIGTVASRAWSGAFVPVAAAFSDLAHGVLVGATSNGAGAGVVATTSDGGRTWTKRILASPPLYGVTMSGSLVLATAACRIDAPPNCQGAILRSTDGGMTWSAASAGGLSGLRLVTGRTAWAIHDSTPRGSYIASSRDGGRAWQRRISPCPAGFPVFEPTGISFPTVMNGWLACDGGGAMGSSAKALFRTRNGGATWQMVFNLSLNGSGGTSGGANEALFAGDTAAVNFLADGTGWLATGAGLHLTHDGGRTWKMLGFDDGAEGIQVNAMQLLSDKTGLILVADITTTPGRVSLENTTDGGRTWTTMTAWSLSP